MQASVSRSFGMAAGLSVALVMVATAAGTMLDDRPQILVDTVARMLEVGVVGVMAGLWLVAGSRVALATLIVGLVVLVASDLAFAGVLPASATLLTARSVAALIVGGLVVFLTSPAGASPWSLGAVGLAVAGCLAGGLGFLIEDHVLTTAGRAAVAAAGLIAAFWHYRRGGHEATPEWPDVSWVGAIGSLAQAFGLAVIVRWVLRMLAGRSSAELIDVAGIGVTAIIFGGLAWACWRGARATRSAWFAWSVVLAAWVAAALAICTGAVATKSSLAMYVAAPGSVVGPAIAIGVIIVAVHFFDRAHPEQWRSTRAAAACAFASAVLNIATVTVFAKSTDGIGRGSEIMSMLLIAYATYQLHNDAKTASRSVLERQAETTFGGESDKLP